MLFKYKILDYYNFLQYKDDYAILHCSRDSVVHAPFDGKVIKINDGVIIQNINCKLYINHINAFDLKTVKAGDIIGTPRIDSKIRDNIAYIGVKLYIKDELAEIHLYLNCISNENIEDTTEVKENIKKETKPKKKRKPKNE